MQHQRGYKLTHQLLKYVTKRAIAGGDFTLHENAVVAALKTDSCTAPLPRLTQQAADRTYSDASSYTNALPMHPFTPANVTHTFYNLSANKTFQSYHFHRYVRAACWMLDVRCLLDYNVLFYLFSWEHCMRHELHDVISWLYSRHQCMLSCCWVLNFA